MAFINIGVTSDPDAIADEAISYLTTAIPGWEPSDGHLETWLIEAIALANSPLMAALASVPPQVFAAFGSQFLGIAQRQGSPAEMTSTWVVESDQGWLIPAGTTVALRTSGDTSLNFTTLVDTTVAPGFTSAVIGLRAVEVGIAANGIPGGTDLELVDSLSYVTSVTTIGASAGGSDVESDGAFLDRLAAEMRLLSPRPILPGDFATLAARIDGVQRALAISGYNPADDTDDNERMVAVALVDADGQPVTSGVAPLVQTYLDGLREINFIVHTMDPTYTTVNVTYQVAVSTGYVGADVIAAVNSALTQLLDPAVWGGGDESPPIWSPTSTVVRYFSVSNVISAVPGVAYVASLLVNGGAADVTLAGAAPLPTAGTMTGSTV